jgi:hypothetical protein
MQQQQQQQQQQIHIGRLLSTVQGGPLLCWIHGNDDNDSSNSVQQQTTVAAASTDKQDATAGDTATDTAATVTDDDITQRSPFILLINPKVDTVLQEYDVLDRPLQDVCYVTSSTTAENTYTAYVLHGRGTVSRLVMSYKDFGLPAVQTQPQTVTVSSDNSSEANTADAVVAVVSDAEQQQQHNIADTDAVPNVDDASTAAAATMLAEGHADESSRDAATDDTLQHSSGQSSSDALLIANSTYALQQAEAILMNTKSTAQAVTPAASTATTVDTEHDISSSDNSVALDSNTALDTEAANSTARVDNRTIMLQTSTGSSFSSSSDGLMSPNLKELLHETDALILETHAALNDSEAAIASTDDITAPTAIEVCTLYDILFSLSISSVT